jgi:predicted deacylase
VEAFTIGGVEVPPGKRRTIDLPFVDLALQTPMSMPVQVVHGRRPGPRLFVNAAVHGDEINGVEIIRRLLNLGALRHIRGTLVAVPVVNVFGFVSLSRNLPDRRDLNRSFPGSARGSLAGRLANLFLGEIVAKCSHGIDLHTGAIHRDNYPQIRVNMDHGEAAQMALSFGVPLVINSGYREGSLREAAARLDIPVIVYEASEALRFDEFAIRAGVRGVVGVMRALGMLKDRKRPKRKPVEPMLVRSSTWVRAAQSGILRRAVALGKLVRKGERLGAIADPFGGNEIEVLSPAEGIVIGGTNLPLVHEGDALFHIGRFEGTQVAAKAMDAFVNDSVYEEELAPSLDDEPPIV